MIPFDITKAKSNQYRGFDTLGNEYTFKTLSTDGKSALFSSGDNLVWVDINTGESYENPEHNLHLKSISFET